MSRRPNAEEAAHLQYETEHTDPGRGKSVVPYMLILIAAAFVLLAIAFFMQERTNQAAAGLNQSANSLRTIDQLVEDNRALREETAQLREELEESQKVNQTLAQELAQVRQELAQAVAAGDAAPSPAPARSRAGDAAPSPAP